MNAAYGVSVLFIIFVIGIFILIEGFIDAKKHNRRKK